MLVQRKDVEVLDGDKDLTLEQYEQVVYTAIGLLKVSLVKGPGDISNAEFVKRMLPLARKINDQIRNDAADKVVGYMMGMGFMVDEEQKLKIREAAKSFRRLTKEEDKDGDTKRG